MSLRHLLGLSFVSALSLVLLPSIAVSQTKSLKDQLIGSWTAASWEQDVKDGPKLQRFGANPKGINVFGADGRFVIIFARGDLPKISANDPNKPTAEEAMAIAKGMIAYYGTYTLDEPAKIVTLKIETSSYPNQLGIEQKRTITSISPTELKYINTTVVGGQGQIYVTLKR
jgi:hypothetical protein